MFDDFLKHRSDGSEFTPFDIDADYFTYVDGKKREDGVRSFLESRDITLPEGEPDDGPDAEDGQTGSATARTTRFCTPCTKTGSRCSTGREPTSKRLPLNTSRSPSSHPRPTRARCWR